MEQNVRAKSKESAKKAKNLQPSTQFAITRVLPNICNGAFWGFTDRASIEQYSEELKQDKNITARLLGNACLIEVNPAYLIKAVQMVDANAVTNKDVNVMQEARAKAIYDFKHFLIRNGKKDAGFGGTVGIYCTNDVTTISYKGVNYPAFRITMEQALQILGAYGFKVRVNGNFVSAQEAANSGQALWSSTKLSPTKTGIFLDIQSTLNPTQMKQIEAQFKAEYSNMK